MSKRHEKIFKVLNYIEHSLIAISTITECVSVTAFASLVENSIGITISAIGLKICVRATRIKKV